MNVAALPHPALDLPRPWASWLIAPLYVVLWSLPGLAALSFYYLNQTVTGAPLDWGFALVSTLPNWYIWAALTPIIITISRSFPLDRTNWKMTVLTVHVPALLGAMLIHSLVNLTLFRMTGIHDSMNFGLYKVHFFSRIHANIFTYTTIVGMYTAFDYYRRYVARERQTSTLQVQLAQANLRALKMQIHPHFLFNTLHSVASLVRKSENKLAVNMLGQLGEFLRIALENKGRQEIPLHQELDFLTRYLSIEQIRFGDRLSVNIDADESFKDFYVPNLILQPIVENAIHHGISPITHDGRIDIIIRGNKDRICMSVRDNGPGLTNPERLRKGVGVRNTQKRLENIYGSDQEFSLQNSEMGGLEVKICIPKSHEPVMKLPDELA